MVRRATLPDKTASMAKRGKMGTTETITLETEWFARAFRSLPQEMVRRATLPDKTASMAKRGKMGTTETITLETEWFARAFRSLP